MALTHPHGEQYRHCATQVRRCVSFRAKIWTTPMVRNRSIDKRNSFSRYFSLSSQRKDILSQNGEDQSLKKPFVGRMSCILKSRSLSNIQPWIGQKNLGNHSQRPITCIPKTFSTRLAWVIGHFRTTVCCVIGCASSSTIACMCNALLKTSGNDWIVSKSKRIVSRFPTDWCPTNVFVLQHHQRDIMTKIVL